MHNEDIMGNGDIQTINRGPTNRNGDFDALRADSTDKTQELTNKNQVLGQLSEKRTGLHQQNSLLAELSLGRFRSDAMAGVQPVPRRMEIPSGHQWQL